MSSTSPVGSATSSTTNTTNTAATDAFSSLTSNDFIQLLTTELQNQDPTQPVDTSTILNEVGQIDSITTNVQLNSTLQAMQLGQDVNTGSSLLGKTITGLDTSSNSVNGVVDSVSVASGVVQLNVGSQVVDLNNVASVTSGSGSTSTTYSASQVANLLDSLLGGSSTNTGSAQ